MLGQTIDAMYIGFNSDTLAPCLPYCREIQSDFREWLADHL